MSDDDNEFAIDLSEMPPEESAAFFGHLLGHAMRGEEDQVVGHIQDVVPSPQNVLMVLMGLCKCLTGVSKVIGGGEPPRAVELKFAHADTIEDMPSQRRILDGDEAEQLRLDSLEDADLDKMPRALRIGGQIMSAGMAGDDETAYALVLPIIHEYADTLDAVADVEEIDVENVVAFQVTTVLAQALVQYADAATEHHVRAATDKLMEEIEAG